MRQSGKQVVFKAAAIANVPIYEVQLSDTLLDEIVSVLGKGEDPWDARLRAILPNQARSYLMAKALLNADSPHQSRKAIMRMVAGLTTALDAMEETFPSGKRSAPFSSSSLIRGAGATSLTMA